MPTSPYCGTIAPGAPFRASWWACLWIPGSPTPQAEHCHRYGLRLASALNLPLAWVNEQCSTWAAAERHGLHGDRSGRLDSAAAALLLEQWLQEGPELKPVQPGGVMPGINSGDDGSLAHRPTDHA